MGLLNISAVLLQLSVSWPIEDNKTKLENTFYKIHRYFVVICITFFCIFQSLGFIRLILKKESFGRLSDSLLILLIITLLLVNKIIFNQNRVLYLFQDIIIYEKAYLSITNDPEMLVIYQAIVKKSKFFNIFILLSCFLGNLFFIGVSFLILNNEGSNFWESDTPFMYELYIPFDRQRYSWLVIVVELCMAYSSSLLYVTIQTTFWVLFMYGILRFQILQLKIDKLSIYGGENSFEKLRSLILEHQNIIK
ncbi:hypothetical protein ABEB36_012593 [Hypothenemus hampei]|uniref:Uncharacterized protein n=1 Tax=Hypothenemus hampei TaxID=57062 RepID=A0ABD1EG26_HYPHA